MEQIFVYFIREGDDGPIKIGRGTNPSNRLAELQIGNPRRFTLIGFFPGDPAIEAGLHRKFAQWRLQGEWFTADAPGLEALARAAGQVAKAIQGGLDLVAAPLAEALLGAVEAAGRAVGGEAEVPGFGLGRPE